MIKAQMLTHSKNTFGNEIATMLVTFPRYILAEFNTHRMLSKNSASSRAIPWEKMIKSVKENPFIPMAWQKNHSGMQGTEYCTPREHEVLNSAWLVGRDKSIEQVEYMAKYANPTKQMINRMLEAYMYHTCVVTGTDWENFFALRCPRYQLPHNDKVFRSINDIYRYLGNLGIGQAVKGTKEKFDTYQDIEGNNYILDKNFWLSINKGQADIHMMALAEVMWDCMNESTPKELKAGEWHIPFGDDINSNKLSELYKNEEFRKASHEANYIQNLKVKIATARCARVSYTVVGEEGKEPNYENDIKLHDRLATSGHMSPFEHCARAMGINEYTENTLDESYVTNIQEEARVIKGISGNLRGFIQYRKMIPNENVTNATKS